MIQQTVFNETEISLSRKLVLKELQNLINIIALEYSKTNLKIKTDLQIILEKKFKKNPEKQICELILHYGLLAEALAPKAFENYLIELNNILSNNKNTLRKQIRTTPATKNDLLNLTKPFFENCKQTQKIFHKAIDLAGYAGKIIVEKSYSNTSSIELTSGFSFEHQPLWGFNTKHTKPRILCIDGFIESVSEIHLLLETLSETKETLLLLVRGLSEEVKHTLKVNYDRKTLQIIPIIVKFDLEGINALNDICVVAGSELISTTKGDLISSLTISSSKVIDFCSLYKDKIILNTNINQASLQAHCKHLIEKRDSEKILDVIELLTKRLKTLTPSHVVIRLLDDKNYILSAQAIDYALRMTKILIERGIYVNNDERTPATSFIISKRYANECAKILQSLGAIVIE